MYKLICAAFFVAAVAFAFLGNPIMGLLMTALAIVWVAATPTLAPSPHRDSPTMHIRMK